MIDDLAEALSGCGFSPTYTLRVTDYGRRKIMVIKTVRDLTRWSLKDTKHAVEAYAPILERIDADTAAHASRRLEDAGASVELRLVEAHLYAFDPDDPRRGEQTVERLRVAEQGFAHEHGKLGEWTEAALVMQANADELLAAIAEQRAIWAAAGKRETDREIVLLDRVSARDHAAEERLRATEGEQRRREAQVYGDWLQSTGDPRGEIAAVALAIDDSDAQAVREHLLACLDAGRTHLLGPAKRLFVPATWTWCGPIVDALVLPGDLPLTCSELAELLAVPVCACLRSLTIASPIDDDHDLGEILAASACAPGLRELCLPKLYSLELPGDRLTRLERLSFAASTFKLACLPALRELSLDITPRLGSLVPCFDGPEPARLEHLRLRINTYDFWDQNYGPVGPDLIELLTRPAFMNLRSLTLEVPPDSPPVIAGFADRFVQIPAIATLERIDLRSLNMSADCRAELAHSRERLPGLLLPEARV